MIIKLYAQINGPKPQRLCDVRFSYVVPSGDTCSLFYENETLCAQSCVSSVHEMQMRTGSGKKRFLLT